jgi:hypothetical protein
MLPSNYDYIDTLVERYNEEKAQAEEVHKYVSGLSEIVLGNVFETSRYSFLRKEDEMLHRMKRNYWREVFNRSNLEDIISSKELWNSEKYQNLLPKSGTKSIEGGDQGELDTVKYISELDAFLISQKASIILVKAQTGEKIWETNRFKGGVGKYIYDKKRNEIILLNFKPTALGALFAGFKNQLVKINKTRLYKGIFNFILSTILNAAGQIATFFRVKSVIC